MAYTLYNSSRQQIHALLFLDPNSNLKEKSNDLFTLFDSDFQNYKEYFNGIEPPNNQNVLPQVLTTVIHELSNCIRSDISIFEETSSTILDFPTLTGFASVWSVIEFVYCMKEIHMTDINDSGPYTKYGAGVIYFASLIMKISNQIPLYKAVCIGSRIDQQRIIDLASLQDNHFNRFISIYQLVRSTFDYSITSFETSLDKSD